MQLAPLAKDADRINLSHLFEDETHSSTLRETRAHATIVIPSVLSSVGSPGNHLPHFGQTSTWIPQNGVL